MQLGETILSYRIQINKKSQTTAIEQTIEHQTIAWLTYIPFAVLLLGMIIISGVYFKTNHSTR